MWIIFALSSAFFAGLTSILAKIGIKKTDSTVATAVRTVVVLLFSWLMVFVVGAHQSLSAISSRSIVFLTLSGLTTGASWICYFRALQIGNVNKVVPVDKTSTILTMILAFLFLGEPFSLNMVIGMILIGAGTYLMIEKKEVTAAQKSEKWLIYALLSALFAALTSILGKIGIEQVNSTFGTAYRTVIVLILAWTIVFAQKKQSAILAIDSKSWLFLILSGFATGASWLCYYAALQQGPASIVAPIDKLSIVLTVIFARLFLKEHLSRIAEIGFLMVIAGTLLLLVKF